ncbi:MAG: D-hexose-6-phosphate mutarotase [Planctomycetes bacterium]|nr:D-hexose-6-phosphate mutarotase [Planctomycetota bacterium]
MTAITELERRFAVPGTVSFNQDSAGLPRVAVANAHAAAEISLVGAQVASFVPRGQRDLLWWTSAGTFDPGSMFRGGIPICWPWFSANPGKPFHGFARHQPWTLDRIDQGPDGTSLILSLDQTQAEKWWPHPFTLTCTIAVGSALEIRLETINRDVVPVRYREAFHTYFSVSDVRRVGVDELDGQRFLDNTRSLRPFLQDAPRLAIAGPIDRVYTGHTGRCAIIDPAFDRRIVIEKSGSVTTVVWNPGEVGARHPDFCDERDWARMLCVETANAVDASIDLDPGEAHTMASRFWAEPISR